MSENKPISIGIRRIKQISFLINEALFKGNEPIAIDFQQIINLDVEKELLFLTLRTIYRYPESSPEQSLLDSHILNVFQIKELKGYVDESGAITFNESIWFTMIGLAISHSRALIFETTSGTVLENTIMPILNPQEIAKSFLEENPNLKAIKND